MDQFAKETLPISLEDEMRRSYLDYAMSVIVGRALPDARDGLGQRFATLDGLLLQHRKIQVRRLVIRFL